MYKWLKKHIDPICPLEMIIPLISCFAVNQIVYSGSMILCADRQKLDFTKNFDQNVPFIPWFVYIYFASFLFWVINYILIARQGKEHFYKFQVADISSRLICLIFFVIIPTTNIRPTFEITSSSTWLMNFLYYVDKPTNLFPSIHCLVSWFCYIGIRKNKSIPMWYKIFTMLFAIAIMVSTQVTKQHYIVDVFGGVAIAELTYFISNRIQLYKYFMRFFTFINAKAAHLLTRHGQLREE